MRLLCYLLFSLHTYCLAQEIELVDSNGGIQITYDTILRNSNPSRILLLKNIGDAPIIFTSIKPSSGLLRYNIIDRFILPDSTGRLSIQYIAKHLGNFTKYLTISTNSKIHPTIRVRVKGVVCPNKEDLIKRLKCILPEDPLWCY
jgi:hypothetical protein